MFEPVDESKHSFIVICSQHDEHCKIVERDDMFDHLIAWCAEALTILTETNAERQVEMIEHLEHEVLLPETSQSNESPARPGTFPRHPFERMIDRPVPLIHVDGLSDVGSDLE